MMRDGQMTVRDVLLDTMAHFGAGDDRYNNLQDILRLLAAEYPQALDTSLPDAVTTEHIA